LSLLDYVQRWTKEPPPEYFFEVSQRGIAWTHPRHGGTVRVHSFPENALDVSPVQPNMLRSDLLDGSVPNVSGKNNQRRIKAGLVVPDYAVRISVLDFEEFPSDEEQRLALVRFRLRKTVPFSIDEAQVSCSLQSADPGQKRYDVLAAAVFRPVLDEYEGLLRSRGFQVGLVLPSSIATLPLCSCAGSELSLLAKLSGEILSILLLEGQQIRLARCVDLRSEEGSDDDHEPVICTLLHQTLAYAEDELGEPVRHLLLCGFDRDGEAIGRSIQEELGLSWEPLRSRLGNPSQENAGLLGLMEQYAA
jgi:type IV pilus assembly protein PilM